MCKLNPMQKVSKEDLLKYIKENPGISGTEVVRRFGFESAKILCDLIDNGEVKTKVRIELE